MEPTSRLEPTHLDAIPDSVANLVAELVEAATILETALPAKTAATLMPVVAVMNCYYSNLIEGHNTGLKDIERALASDFAPSSERRSLQLEAVAHINVQYYVHWRFLQDPALEPASGELIRELHKGFYKDATPDMLQVGTLQMRPGVMRSLPAEDNFVGKHQPPSSTRVADFMKYFEERYRFAGSGKATRILMMAIAHHRFNYIHPFLDGNGRVSRLMSHAMGLAAGIGANGLWSISRGLARGLNDRSQYKRMMDHADSPRQGDLDGRGNLSRKALIEYVEWFLSVALDQVRFMTKLFDFGTLTRRYEKYIAMVELKPESVEVVKQILLRGDLPRGEVARVTGMPERSARGITQGLHKHRLVSSTSPKSSLFLTFPAEGIPTLFPDLYGAQAVS